MTIKACCKYNDSVIVHQRQRDRSAPGRQTDRQTDRQTETQTDTETCRQRQTGRQTDRDRDRETCRQRQTKRDREIEIDGWRCEHARFCVEVFYALYINFHSFIHGGGRGRR